MRIDEKIGVEKVIKFDVATGERNHRGGTGRRGQGRSAHFQSRQNPQRSSCGITQNSCAEDFVLPLLKYQAFKTDKSKFQSTDNHIEISFRVSKTSIAQIARSVRIILKKFSSLTYQLALLENHSIRLFVSTGSLSIPIQTVCGGG